MKRLKFSSHNMHITLTNSHSNSCDHVHRIMLTYQLTPQTKRENFLNYQVPTLICNKTENFLGLVQSLHDISRLIPIMTHRGIWDHCIIEGNLITN